MLPLGAVARRAGPLKGDETTNVRCRWRKAVLRLLLLAVQARRAVVAFPQGSTCLCQEITLQTCRLALQTCPSSIGVLSGSDSYLVRYSSAVLPLLSQ